jgi:hypothetical protein
MNRFLLILLNISVAGLAFAQNLPVVNRWSYNTAFLTPKGKWESGLIQPFRYGINRKIELSANILLFPILPNAGLKVSWGESKGYTLASEHILSIPSVFLNTVSRKGTGGLLSPEFDFPFIVGLNNSLIASKPVLESSLLTFKAGLVIALHGGNVDPLATIDLPLFYPRMAQYYKGSSLRLSSSFKGSIFNKWDYEEGIQFFLVTRKEYNMNIENSGSLNWAPFRSFRIKGGYILTYGSYPFGNHWQIWPTLDLVFGSRL